MMSRRERYEETQKRLHAKMRQDLMEKQQAMVASGQFNSKRDVLVQFSRIYDTATPKNCVMY